MTITFSALKTKIQDTAEQDDTEFAAAVPGFITDSEARLSRDLKVPVGLTVHKSAALTGSDPYLARWSNAVVIEHLAVVDGNGAHQAVERRTPEFIQTYWPTRTSTGLPKYYAEWGRNSETGLAQLFLAPTPDQSYTVNAQIKVRITPLSDSNTTNWYSTYTEDLLFYACMRLAEMFDKNHETPAAERWEQLYQDALTGARQEAVRQFTDDFAAGPHVTA